MGDNISWTTWDPSTIIRRVKKKKGAVIPAAHVDTVTDVLTEVCVYERRDVGHKIYKSAYEML